MRRTFNMGIGFACIVERAGAPRMLESLREAGERAFEIGEVIEGNGVTFST